MILKGLVQKNIWMHAKPSLVSAALRVHAETEIK